MNHTTRGLIMLGALACVITTASAQVAGAQDPRAGYRLDAVSKAAISAVIDSVRAQGLPTQPLLDRVNEGVAKGADGPRILVSVRALAFDMVTIHRALGTIATADELKAAASAMHAGVPPVELGKMKRQSGLLRSLATPFTVMADLVSRGVPVSTAVNAVRSLVGAGAKDKDINDFQRNVKEDIQQGAPPAAAAETRAKASSNGKPAPKETKPEEQIDFPQF